MHKPPPDSQRLRPVAHLGALIAFLALAILEGGCACPKPVRTYEVVVSYERMTDRFDPLVSLVYMPDETALSKYRNFVVGPVQPGSELAERSEAVEGYGTFFRHMLQKELVRSQRFTFVTLDPLAVFPTPAVVLEGKVTRFETGSGLLRYLNGLFLIFASPAATDFQVEGRIVDARTGVLIMEFVDRRRHLGNTAWGPNPRTLNDDFVMKVTVRQTAECLGKFISSIHAGLPPD